MINFGIIGYGYWGPRVLRNIENNNFAKNIAICDLKKKIIKKKEYVFYKNYKDLGLNNKIDAIIIATPVNSHYEIAKFALENNKHVWIEKPMTSNSTQAKKLIELSIKKNKILFVDHPYIYSESIKKIKKIINNKKSFGDLYYYDSTRVNLGIFRGDSNVIWDLAVHDLSIINYLTNFKSYSINARANKHYSNNKESIGFLRIQYENNFLTQINVNWLAPIKIRQTFITGSKKMLLFNDVKDTDKVQVFNKGIINNDIPEKIGYRSGNIMYPQINNIEPLNNAINDFINCINKNKKPVSNGLAGLETIKILEAANISVRNNGKEIKIK